VYYDSPFGACRNNLSNSSQIHIDIGRRSKSADARQSLVRQPFNHPLRGCFFFQGPWWIHPLGLEPDGGRAPALVDSARFLSGTGKDNRLRKTVHLSVSSLLKSEGIGQSFAKPWG